MSSQPPFFYQQAVLVFEYEAISYAVYLLFSTHSNTLAFLKTLYDKAQGEETKLSYSYCHGVGIHRPILI